MKFPIVKNVSAKTIASELESVSPRMDGPAIKETYTDHMGCVVTVYENGGRTTHSYSQTHLFGDYGHAFGQGYFIVNKDGKMVFVGDEEYNDLANLCRPYWQVLKGLQEKFNEYKVQPSRGERIAVNDKIIKGVSFYPGMRMKSVEESIEGIAEFIQKDIDRGRIVKGKYGI